MYKFFIALLIVVILVFSFLQKPWMQKVAPETTVSEIEKEFEVVKSGLDIPWELVFLPEGDVLVTQRGGKLLRIGEEDKIIAEIEGVKHIGEGGLLGMALDPDFSNNRFIYLYSTTQAGNEIKNKVERYKFNDDKLSDQKILVDNIKGSRNHGGGRIAFGPDGYLYVTTGDAENPSLAQDINSLNGKILRIDKDGKVEIYSIGHRNPQGLAWDKNGNMWSTEHGPSGLQSGNDEINLIVKGGNYGWPTIKGEKRKDGLITPTRESGDGNTWAPSGMTIIDDNIFFAGLRGEALYRANIVNTDNLVLSTYFKNKFGRIRTVTVGLDGYLYLLTNNTDGRGSPKEGDDKIIRVSVKKLLSQ